MDRTYKLLVTDDDVVHECISMPRDLSDLALCGVEVKDMRRPPGPGTHDDNLRVVKAPVTCVGCLGVTEDAKIAMLRRHAPLKYRVMKGGTRSFQLDRNAPNVDSFMVAMRGAVILGAGAGQAFTVGFYNGALHEVTPTRPLQQEVDASSVVEF